MTPFPSTLAHWQALAVWTLLEDARITPELPCYVAAYHLIPNNPYLATALEHPCVGESPGGASAIAAAKRQTRDALVGLARAFEVRRNVRVMIDGMTVDAFAAGDGFAHGSVRVEVF